MSELQARYCIGVFVELFLDSGPCVRQHHDNVAVNATIPDNNIPNVSMLVLSYQEVIFLQLPHISIEAKIL